MGDSSQTHLDCGMRWHKHKTGDICWINGPFLLAEWNELEISCPGLMTWLEVFE